MSSQLAGYGKKESRRELDFYPTPPQATIALMEFVQLKPSNVWEPACGDGSMSKVIESYGHRVFSTDISTEYRYGNSNIDFLDPLVDLDTFDAIITNPPFKLSVQFIEKALTLAPFVAMLLKSQYWHSKSRYNLFIKTQPAYVLPLTWRPDFMNHERGGRPTMEVLWTVWIRGSSKTEYKPLIKP